MVVLKFLVVQKIWAFGIKNKSNFWVSYKHGEYKDSSGKELKSSFQQYGTLKTFYTKEFNSG